MDRILKMLAGAAVAATASYFVLSTPEAPQETPVPVVQTPVLPPAPVITPIPHEIQSGESFGKIAQAFGLPSQTILTATLPVYDLARIRAGRTLTFMVSDQATTPHEIRYPLGEDQTLVIRLVEDVWQAEISQVEYSTIQAVREFTVNSSFWAAAVQAGLRARDIASLAEVYQYDVDFNTEIRMGATVKMVVEERYLDGEFVKLGRPLAVRFTNSGDEYLAIHHVSVDKTGGYYDAKGIARKKAFLRSPLQFSRVTSGYNPKRYHPILKRRRPHNGVDFGAKRGTSVRATGEGVVTYAGRRGGHGNFVKIKHSGAYESSYSHLSKIKVKKGQRISQGRVIGLVGSTGMSTGPHLHYQFWVNGRYVNPMTAKLPRKKSLSKSELERFQTTRDEWLHLLDSVGPALADG